MERAPGDSATGCGSASPAGQRVGKLSGDRAGEYSVPVNAQWRVCFTWSLNGASHVELVDNH